jgi:hypothetical protein
MKIASTNHSLIRSMRFVNDLIKAIYFKFILMHQYQTSLHEADNNSSNIPSIFLMGM